jgi:hypothetical protein
LWCLAIPPGAQQEQGNMATPTTKNEAWGFWGTWNMKGKGGTEKAWAGAVDALVTGGFTAEQARDILDGRVGRHMADQMDRLADVEPTIQRLLAHRGWRKEMTATARAAEGEAL